MSTRPRQRLSLIIALALACSPLLRAAAKPDYYTGRVVPLTEVLAGSGLKIDKAAAARWLALSSANGKVYPLINEDNGRMFYVDKSLLNRPMRLTAQEVGGNLRVFQVHSLIKGELHEVYYWCDICTIKRFEKKECECCGAPMELREELVTK